MNFFERQKELSKEATSRPWSTEEYSGKIFYNDRDGIICQHVHSDSSAAYIVFAVNNMDRVCELLAKAIDESDCQCDGRFKCTTCEIQAALKEMG